MRTTSENSTRGGSPSGSAPCSASFNSWLFVTLVITFQMGFLVDAVLWRIDTGKTEHIIYPAVILVAVTVSWVLLIIRRPNIED